MSAPKLELSHDLYSSNFPNCSTNGRYESGFVTTEAEPVFDAAGFVRCGLNLFAIRSNTTNQ
jgi:glycine amidinotransferase